LEDDGERIHDERTTGITFSGIHGLNGGVRDENIKETDPEKELVHGTRLDKDIVSIHGLGDGLERVHVSWDTDKVSGHKSHNGEHGGTAMTQFGFPEKAHKWRVTLGQVQL
jgi:hypothetical protein